MKEADARVIFSCKFCALSKRLNRHRTIFFAFQCVEKDVASKARAKMAVFENGLFNFSAYTTSEYVVLGIALLFVLGVIGISIALTTTVKRYRKNRKTRQYLQQIKSVNIERSEPFGSEISSERKPLLRHPKPLPPLPPRSASTQYSDVPWSVSQSAQRPLPRLPRNVPQEQAYGALPARALPAQPSAASNANLGDYKPQRLNQYRMRPVRRNYQPFRA